MKLDNTNGIDRDWYNCCSPLFGDEVSDRKSQQVRLKVHGGTVRELNQSK